MRLQNGVKYSELKHTTYTKENTKVGMTKES